MKTQSLTRISPASINNLGGGMSHRDYAETNQHFRACCEAGNVQPTKRQAAKFRRGEGSAYANKHKALEIEANERRLASMKEVIKEVQSRGK